jgi:hypothetical protein
MFRSGSTDRSAKVNPLNSSIAKSPPHLYGGRGLGECVVVGFVLLLVVCLFGVDLEVRSRLVSIERV